MPHESGHAAYDIFIDHRLPYLLRQPAHTFVTEAIALMSGALVRDPDWLKQVAGFSADQVDPLAKDLHSATAASELLFSRWGLVMVHFERDLYADPEGDLDERWWRYVERFQKVRVPEGAAPVGAWASKIHIAAAPVYYQNYLLGNLLAAQLVATARDEFGGVVGVPETGRMLKERVFKHGCLYPWSELIVKATGRELGAADFAAQLAV
jgi:peptidyl-dipeptidase A